jgi:t-SNARE complex subunit (syntaxin)
VSTENIIFEIQDIGRANCKAVLRAVQNRLAKIKRIEEDMHKFTTKDGTAYNLTGEVTEELRGTHDVMTVHEAFEEQAPHVPPKHRYEIWLAVN